MASTTNLGIDSADAQFFYGVEDANGVVTPGDYVKLLVNDITQAGATITTTEDEPLGAGSQRRKGRTTGLESGFAFNGNIRKGQAVEFIGAFLKSVWSNDGLAKKTGAVASASSFTALSVSAADRAKLVEKKLIYVSGSDSDVNNGVFEVSGAVAAGQNATISVTANNLVSGGSAVTISAVGYRFDAGDANASYDDTSKKLTITTSSALNLGTQGLTTGTPVFFGEPSGSGFTRSFATGGAAADRNKAWGWAIYEGSNAGNTIHTFGRVAPRLKNNDLEIQSSQALSMLFSRYASNRLKTDPEYLLKCYQFGVLFPDLTGAGDSYEFIKGNVANTFSATFNPGAFATYSIGFVGTDTDVNVLEADGAARLGTAKDDIDTRVFSCAQDFGRLRFIDHDEAGLSTIFENMTFTLGNNATPKNVLAVLGAERINQGRFDCTMGGSLIYTAPQVKEFIRENTDIAGAFAIHNDEGAIYVEIPSITLADGSNGFVRNDQVNVTLTGTAHADNEYDRTVLVGVIDMPIEGDIREAVA